MQAVRHVGGAELSGLRVLHLTLRAVCLAHHLNLNDVCPCRAV